jgi:hypothetical protein
LASPAGSPTSTPRSGSPPPGLVPSATTAPDRRHQRLHRHPELIETARKWLKQAAGGVDGDNEHHPFPGYQPEGHSAAPCASTASSERCAAGTFST